MKYLLTILFFLFAYVSGFSQDSQHISKPADNSIEPKMFHKDSVRLDTAHKKTVVAKPAKTDSLKINSTTSSTTITDSSSITNDSLIIDSLKKDSIVHVIKKSIPKKPAIQLMAGTERHTPDKDIIFYILVFLVFFLGLVKTSFPKYVNSIFSLTFQATFRQTQTREQMSQNFFPAIMLNLLFVLCGGLFITQFAIFNNWTKIPFWQLFIFSTGILLIVYVVKYLVIIFTGWVFNTKEAATEYRFVVFLINKLLGIVIIPILFLIAYSNYAVQNVAITIVVCLAIASLAVRYLVSLARIRKNLSVTAFHFFIYLCAVEIMPLLVIYKVLFLHASNT